MKALRRTALSTTFSLLAVVTAGCGGDDEGGTQNSWQEARAAQTAAAEHCDCFAALGYGSSTSCQSDVSPDAVTAAQTACVGSLYETSAVTMNARFRCLAEVYAQFGTCMSAVTACDAAAVDACVGAVQTGVSVCPALDSTTQASFEACLSSGS